MLNNRIPITLHLCYRIDKRKEKGLTPYRRKSLYCKVPKRGLEPPLPLREPGPEPGASASSATSARPSSDIPHIKAGAAGVKWLGGSVGVAVQQPAEHRHPHDAQVEPRRPVRD